MRTSRSIPLAGLLALTFAFPGVPNAQVQDPIQYGMVNGSAMEYGCFGPCACPIIMSGPMTGSFTLYRTSVDPLYTHYAMLNIDWTYATGDTGTEIIAHAHGQGTYDIGGEVAAMQRMTLDLTIEDPRVPPFMQHYDSGLVPTRAAFPAIDIDAHLKIDDCRDSVFRVVAKPGGSSGVGPSPTSRMLRSAGPNPTTAAVDLTFAPPRRGRARVDVVDVRGRVVASLVDGEVGPDELHLRWNGRDRRRGDAGAGIFWITARAGGRTEALAVVRLR